MKRGEVTTVEKLIPGDRFYKQKASDRKTYELIGPESFGKFEVCLADKMVNGSPISKSRIEVVRGNTSAVFLRNVKDN